MTVFAAPTTSKGSPLTSATSSAYNISMTFTSVVEPAETVLRDLSALVVPMYNAFDAGIEEARRYFAHRNRAPDPHLFPHLVRYEALFQLALSARVEIVAGDNEGDEEGGGVADELKAEVIRLRGLPNSGIQYRSSAYLLRAMKSTADGLVPPPRSCGGARWEFFSQEEQGVLEDLGASFRPLLRLVLLWQATPELTLQRLSLACPRRASAKQVEVYWQIEIPRAIASVVDDLPIERLPGAATGTTDSRDEPE